MTTVPLWLPLKPGSSSIEVSETNGCALACLVVTLAIPSLRLPELSNTLAR